MPTDKELMQQALDALQGNWRTAEGDAAIKALCARLAQPEPESVANIRTWHKDGELHAELWNWDRGIESLPDGEHNLYIRPQTREWVGLTDDDIKTMWDNHIIPVFNKHGISPFVFARAIEAKLKKKNG